MVLLATVLLIGSVAQIDEPSFPSTRIGTLNIHASESAQPNDISASEGLRWGVPDYRRLLVRDQIRNASLDIFALQEVKPDQLNYLSQEFAATHLAIPGCLTRRSQNDFGFSNISQPIFVELRRFAVEESGCLMLSTTPSVIDSHSWGSGPRVVSWVRLIDRLNGSTTYILNVHLAARKDQEHARQESAKLIVEFINMKTKWSDEVVLAGDLNSKPDAAVHKILSEDGRLKDSSSRATMTLGPFRTYNSLGDASPNYKIDYIYSRHSEPTRYEVHEASTEGKFPSDHNLVVGEFRYIVHN